MLGANGLCVAVVRRKVGFSVVEMRAGVSAMVAEADVPSRDAIVRDQEGVLVVADANVPENRVREACTSVVADTVSVFDDAVVVMDEADVDSGNVAMEPEGGHNAVEVMNLASSTLVDTCKCVGVVVGVGVDVSSMGAMETETPDSDVVADQVERVVFGVSAGVIGSVTTLLAASACVEVVVDVARVVVKYAVVDMNATALVVVVTTMGSSCVVGKVVPDGGADPGQVMFSKTPSPQKRQCAFR
mmetsp:Transcript_78536/g.226998  ORF Transcript_78536/g.226998 Transcript_78536/m.226998 type:complete len:244 (-) Transcript_78536:530-1261(-)